MHHFTHPALRDAVARHLERERARMGLIIDHLNEQSQLKAAVRQTGE
jgi:predicted N-acyltransferase